MQPPERDQPYLSMLDGVSFQPVFIMGDHRSGTTILYKVLGASAPRPAEVDAYARLIYQRMNRTSSRLAMKRSRPQPDPER